MIGQQDLQELLDLGGEAQVLSVYLGTDLSHQQKEQCKLVLREKLSAVADKSLAKDVERIGRFFDYEYDWQAKGAAIFSCEQCGLWRAYPLSVPVRDLVFVAAQPYVKPLMDLMEEYKPYVVALVDREGARLFVVELGEIREADEVYGEIIKRHKQGGWSQATLQRHSDMQVLHNLKAVAQETSNFCRKQACEGLVLAGSEENLAQFRELLSKHWQSRIIGTISADMTTSSTEILNKSMQVVLAARRAQDEALVSQMVTSAAKGEAGVIGLADTLYAVREGRVHMLLVEQGYEAPGALCPSCGYVSAAQGQKCLFCSSEMRPVDNAVDLATQKTVEQGGQVRVIGANEALENAGHIGAILRY